MKGFYIFSYAKGSSLLRMVALLVCLGVGFSSHSQSNDSMLANPEAWFDRAIGIENAGIINGPEYKMAQRGASSHPFFGSGETHGRMLYDHRWYDVTFLYDEYKDEVVVKHIGPSGRGWFIELEKTRVQRFMIGDRLFLNFNQGFYEVIFDSPEFQVVSKRAKVTQIKNGIFNYVVNDEFFIVQSGQWKRLRNKQSFLKMVEKEDRRAVSIYIQQHKIRVGRFNSAELANVAGFVNTRLRKRS